MLNKVMLIGNLGRDPEMKFTPSGTAIANFSIATTERWTKDGQKNEKTEWHKIVAWQRLAEICGEYLHRGSQVYVSGKLQTRSWDDKEGNKKYTTEIVINQMQMLGRKGESNQPQTGDNEYPVDGGDRGPEGTNPGDTTEDGEPIPF